LVDVTPTILDILGLLPSFNADLQNRPDDMKGHSLTQAIDRILTKDPSTGSDNVCGSHITAPLP
jgi:arylsulfatase A-like enzyme